MINGEGKKVLSCQAISYEISALKPNTFFDMLTVSVTVNDAFLKHILIVLL